MDYISISPFYYIGFIPFFILDLIKFSVLTALFKFDALIKNKFLNFFLHL